MLIVLTTYIFRYTSERTISLSNLPRLRRQGGIDPLTKILRTFLLMHPDIGAATAEKLEGTSHGVDTDNPQKFSPYSFAVSRVIAPPLVYPTLFSISPLNFACRDAQRKMTK